MLSQMNPDMKYMAIASLSFSLVFFIEIIVHLIL